MEWRIMDFKPYVDRLFRQAADRSYSRRSNPIIGGHWLNGVDRVGPQKEAACRALVVRAWFAWSNPGMPALPLSAVERSDLKRLRGSDYLLSEYAASLEGQKYDTFKHPPFEQYARGVMACPLAPEFIRNDPKLLKRYPLRPLPGLGPGLCWNDPAKLPS
jgi:hypothetical protein